MFIGMFPDLTGLKRHGVPFQEVVDIFRACRRKMSYNLNSAGTAANPWVQFLCGKVRFARMIHVVTSH